jgi:hypothetical protein
MSKISFVEAPVVEDHSGLGPLRLELKFHERVFAGIPAGGTPGMHDALIGNQFDISSYDPGA